MYMYSPSMLIPSATIIEHLRSANIKVDRVLHIGAHDCQEAGFYRDLGVTPDKTVWIDALDEKIARAAALNIPNVYKAVITDTDDANIIFNVSNNEQSSSVLDLGTHRQEHPDVFYVREVREKTVTLDTFLKRNSLDPAFTFWNIDIQGAELLALKGGEAALKGVNAIYLEVNEKPLYKDCPLIGELDKHLLQRGFKRVETAMTQHGWGDALYLRTSPRILMLVLANDDGGLYSGLQEITKLYMRSNPQIDCHFIKGREGQEEEFMLEEHSLYIKTREGYSNDALFKKTMGALRFFESAIDTYDYIYRTNLSTFVRFDIFLEFCRTLPTTNVYCGHKLRDYGIDFVSGTGIIMSRDIVKRLLKEPPSFFIQDDLTIGKTMSSWGISIIDKQMLGIQPDNLHVADDTSLQKLQNILDNPGDAYQIRVRTGDTGRLERDLKIHQALYRQFY